MAAVVQPQTQQLELAHVLFLDIARPSSQAASEQDILGNLQEFVDRTSEFGRARANDQVKVVPSGDGLALVFFGDPEAPLRCALEICRSGEKTRVRMGLHSWPVCRMDDLSLKRTVSDGGINVARRVMDCGDQGHILASGFVADMLLQLGSWKDALHDLGEIEVNQGLRLHVFNFWNSEAGNPEVPRKLLRSHSPRDHDNDNKGQPGIINETISHYRIVSKLGSGGMGVVYEAEDIRLGRHVAIKVLSEKFSNNSAAIERFQREACTASALNHPNICTVHDVGEQGGRHFIVMELLEGKNLRQVMLPAPLAPEEMAAYGIQIADGLEAAHKRGIVHRDIKPANLFVIEGKRVKILDFGLAKLTGRERSERAPLPTLADDEPTRQSVTGPGEFVGTVSYMSPEQARGEPLDHRTDLFSFGVVLYEMVTGLLPFRGETSAVVFDSILNRAPTPVQRVNPLLSPEVDRIIARALDKRRETRYQSAADLGAELRRLAAPASSSVVVPAPRPEPKTKELQVVLLYRRNVEPDEQIMRALDEKLAAQGYRVFVDRHLAVGVDWAREIENKISAADAVVALLSASSVQSEMLAYEVQLANSFAERQNGKPRLLPVRVQFQSELPDPLHSALDGLNYALWNDAADNDKIVAELEKALEVPQEAFRRRPNLEPVGGALALDSKFYIVRPTDHEFYSAVARHDSIVLLKGARQMGKTSLMARGLQQARKAGARVVLTDFQKLNSAHLQSVDTLFLCLAQAIAEQLDLDAAPEDSWNARRGPSMNFERFLRREILGQINGRLVWGMDEVDRLFSCSFGSEVFGLFRSWHNERSLDPSGPWQNLSLAIAYASEAHLFITDVNQSPFNVGTRLVLADFTLDQVRELNQRYGCPLRDDGELERFFSLLGGQPFLTQRGLHQMADRNISFNEFTEGAARDEGPYGDHLRRIFVSLNQDPALCEVVRSVISGRHSSSTDSFYRLRSSGLVAGECAREMKLRCQLYEQYLSRHLI